jgi:hypothetical protein
MINIESSHKGGGQEDTKQCRKRPMLHMMTQVQTLSR